VETLDFIKTFTAKDGSKGILRPVTKDDAFDITTKVQAIIKNGQYIQKEKVRSLEDEQAFIDEMKQKKNMYTAVEMHNRVVGIARILKDDLKMKEHTGLFRTWLTDEAQGKGIGNQIMEYALEWGQRAKLHKIWLTVFSGNEGATYLYKKYGFVEEGIQKDQVQVNGIYQDEIYMAYFFLKPADVD
jgi:RimJ/RimL family protein N-acetyltransferase